MAGDRENPWATALAASVGVVVAVAGAPAWAEKAPPAVLNGQTRAEEILRSMAKRLAKSETLRVRVIRELDAALVRETGLPGRARIEVSVKRPFRLRARSIADDNIGLFLADGERVTVFDEMQRVYATASASGPIEEMARKLQEQFGFAPPLAELLANDPYQSIRARARTMRYGGEQTIDGQTCHQLLLSGEDSDAELFVSVADDLPCKLIATFKATGRDSKLRMSFSGWQLGVPLGETDFVFAAPSDAKEAKLVPVDAPGRPAGGAGR